MAVRWQFIEERENAETCWTWRIMVMDGALQTQSQRFKTYGAAVGDAIRNGFRPNRHYWTVVTRHTATHFRPGEPQVSVPIVGPGGQAGIVMPLGEKKPRASSRHPRTSKRPVNQ
jgi:hypothetical protein